VIREPINQKGGKMSDKDINIGFYEFRTSVERMARSEEVEIYPHDETGADLPEHHFMCIPSAASKRRKDRPPMPRYCHTEPFLLCDCPDFEWNEDTLCKHLVAALMLEEHPLMKQTWLELEADGRL
jgi:hypothetical protein